MGPQAVVLFDLHRDGPRSTWVYALNRRYMPSLRSLGRYGLALRRSLTTFAHKFMLLYS